MHGHAHFGRTILYPISHIHFSSFDTLSSPEIYHITILGDFLIKYRSLVLSRGGKWKKRLVSTPRKPAALCPSQNWVGIQLLDAIKNKKEIYRQFLNTCSFSKPLISKETVCLFSSAAASSTYIQSCPTTSPRKTKRKKKVKEKVVSPLLELSAQPVSLRPTTTAGAAGHCPQKSPVALNNRHSRNSGLWATKMKP